MSPNAHHVGVLCHRLLEIWRSGLRVLILRYGRMCHLNKHSVKSPNSWLPRFHRDSASCCGPITNMLSPFLRHSRWVNGVSSVAVNAHSYSPPPKSTPTHHGFDEGGELQHDWIPGQGCANLRTNNKVLAATYAVSTVLDIVVLTLSFWKLRILTKATQKSKLTTMLFRDGLIYFIVAWVPPSRYPPLHDRCPSIDLDVSISPCKACWETSASSYSKSSISTHYGTSCSTSPRSPWSP